MMPSQVGLNASNYSNESDVERKSFSDSQPQEEINNGINKSPEYSSINNSTATMSLAGSLSLGKSLIKQFLHNCST